MKHFILSSLFTLIVLTLFILLNTDTLFSKQNIPLDEEQNGLSDQITVKFSHVVAENTPKGLAAQKFADLVYENTNGLVKVEIFPNGILYSDGDELDALKQGDIQIIAPSISNMTEIVPEWKVLDLPFVFQDYQHVETVLSGEIGKELLHLLEKKEMKALAFWSNGFKQMTSSVKPLTQPSDFKNQTFRTMNGEIVKKQFSLLGAVPISTSFTEVYSSLENREVTGQENTISNIYTKGLYKFQQHLTISNHGFLGYSVVVNNSFWNSLSTDIQEGIQNALKETTRWNMNESQKMNDEQLKEIEKSSNIHIYSLSNEEKENWKSTFLPLYNEIEKEFDRDLLSKIRKVK